MALEIYLHLYELQFGCAWWMDLASLYNDSSMIYIWSSMIPLLEKLYMSVRRSNSHASATSYYSTGRRWCEFDSIWQNKTKDPTPRLAPWRWTTPPRRTLVCCPVLVIGRRRSTNSLSETERRGEAIAGPRVIGDGETRGDGTEWRVTEGGGFWKKFTITKS
jgi:hypothetical protein